MYYRQKLLLTLISNLPSGAGNTRLHKLMFLLSKKQPSPAYDFVPYQYGCYSFQLQQDIKSLERQQLIFQFAGENSTEWKLSENAQNYPIRPEDLKLVKNICRDFGTYTRKDLIHYTYRHYPYYAINSTIAKDILDEGELEKIKIETPKVNPTLIPELFTIGYEGISLETYINQLIRNNIRTLCDVRKNAYSMKFGFSLSQLKAACNGVNIQYIHIPELGIESNLRKDLDIQLKRDDLFDHYEMELLPKHNEQIHSLIDIIKSHQRVAITCFEHDVCQCHRGRLAKVIAQKEAIAVIHL